MPNFFIFVMLALFGQSARADDCSCDRYAAVAPIRSLALDVARIGIGTLDTSGREFDAEAYRLKLSADLLVPSCCKSSRSEWKTPRLKFISRIELGNGAVNASAGSERANGILNSFESTVIRATGCGAIRSGPLPPGTVQCLTEQEQQAYGTVSKLIVNPINDNYRSNALGLGAEDFRLLQIYVSTLNSAAPLAELAKYKNQLSTEEKLILAQMFGEKFAQAYDFARKNGGPTSEGVVTVGNIFEAAKYNSSHVAKRVAENYNAYARYIGVPPTEVPGYGMADAGVCRDIATAQAEILKTLGMKRTYVVAFASMMADEADYHTSVITQDPARDRKVYVLDYGSRSNNTGGDSRALFQGMADGSLNYRLYNPSGKMAADVQSEFGKFMTEAAGFDIRTLDPLARPHGSLVGAQYSATETTQVRVGAGTDGFKNYIFTGASRDYLQNSLFPGRVGLVLATQNTSPVYNNGIEDRNLDLLYIQLEQRFNSPWHRFSPDIEARIETLALAIAAAGRYRGSDAWTFQGDARVSAGAHVQQKISGEKFVTNYRAGVQAVPGTTEVRDKNASMMVVWNHLFFSAEGRLALSQTAEGRAYLIAATTVLVDQLGERGRIEAGIVTNKTGAIVTVEGRLSHDSANFLDGSGRKVRGTLVWQPSDFIRLSVLGDVPIEKDDRPLNGLGVMGTVELRQ